MVVRRKSFGDGRRCFAALCLLFSNLTSVWSLHCRSGEMAARDVVKYERVDDSGAFDDRFSVEQTSSIGSQGQIRPCCLSLYGEELGELVLLERTLVSLLCRQADGCRYEAVKRIVDGRTGRRRQFREVYYCVCRSDECNRLSELTRPYNAITFAVKSWLKKKMAVCWCSTSVPRRLEQWGNENGAGGYEQMCAEKAEEENWPNGSLCFGNDVENWFCCCKESLCNNVREQSNMDPRNYWPITIGNETVEIAADRKPVSSRTANAVVTTSNRSASTTTPGQPFCISCFNRFPCFAAVVLGMLEVLAIILLAVYVAISPTRRGREQDAKRQKLKEAVGRKQVFVLAAPETDTSPSSSSSTNNNVSDHQSCSREESSRRDLDDEAQTIGND